VPVLAAPAHGRAHGRAHGPAHGQAPMLAAASGRLPAPALGGPPWPAGEPLPPVSLVVGFDNSEPARRALRWAARLLDARPGSLHVVYADHPVADSDLSGFASAEMAEARDTAAAGIAAAAAEITAGTAARYTFERRREAPADAILSGAGTLAAAEPGGDPLIVVGRSGHARHHVIGAVPARLLNRSPYPVLAIP
jgi:nucleotide-binding universal stress UspA family protein